MKQTAWMIRNDGKMIPVDYHIYGNEEDIRNHDSGPDMIYQETVDAAIWLYKNTRKQKTKGVCMEFLTSWLFSLVKPEKRTDAISLLFQRIENRDIYKGTTDWNFFLKHREDLYECSLRSLEEAAMLVLAELDQEFLRARIGGMYNSEEGNMDMYFRISSSGFDWHDIITETVKMIKPETITILRDPESTGEEGFYVYDGIRMDHVSYERFLTIGKPIQMKSRLHDGSSLKERYGNITIKRLFMKYTRDIFEERKLYIRN